MSPGVRTAADGAVALREALLAEGGTLADALDGAVRPPGSDEPGPAQLAAAGPRAAGLEREYELLVEMILEGSRLHYGEASVVGTADADLALLLGDQLYALGLARLASLGDIAAISELADVISLVAQAHAASRPRAGRRRLDGRRHRDRVGLEPRARTGKGPGSQRRRPGLRRPPGRRLCAPVGPSLVTLVALLTVTLNRRSMRRPPQRAARAR